MWSLSKHITKLFNKHTRNVGNTFFGFVKTFQLCCQIPRCRISRCQIPRCRIPRCQIPRCRLPLRIRHLPPSIWYLCYSQQCLPLLESITIEKDNNNRFKSFFAMGRAVVVLSFACSTFFRVRL